MSGDFRHVGRICNPVVYLEKILLACGGPNIYLDTREGCVKGYWGAGCYAESYLHRGAVDAVDEYFEEQFNYLRESY